MKKRKCSHPQTTTDSCLHRERQVRAYYVAPCVLRNRKPTRGSLVQIAISLTAQGALRNIKVICFAWKFPKNQPPNEKTPTVTLQGSEKSVIFAPFKNGKMPEWSNGPHSKCGERVTVPGVRIPLFPRKKVSASLLVWNLFYCLSVCHELTIRVS